MLKTGITQVGMDSLGAVQLRAALEARFGLSLAPTVVFDYPTAAALADMLCALLEASRDSTQAPMPTPGSAMGKALHAAVHVLDVSSGYPQGVKHLALTRRSCPCSRYAPDSQLPHALGGNVKHCHKRRWLCTWAVGWCKPCHNYTGAAVGHRLSL